MSDQNNCNIFIDEIRVFKYLLFNALLLVCLFVISKVLYEIKIIDEKIFFLFHLDKETNIPTWYSTVQLFAVGLICLTIAFQKKILNFPMLEIVFWFCMAVGFCSLSIDEMVSIHEMFDRSRLFGTKLKYRWVIYFIPIVIGVIILFFISARKIFENQKKIFFQAFGRNMLFLHRGNGH